MTGDIHCSPNLFQEPPAALLTHGVSAGPSELEATSAKESVTKCYPSQGHVLPLPLQNCPAPPTPPKHTHFGREVCSNSGSQRVEFQAPVMKLFLGKERGCLESCKLFVLLIIAWSILKSIDLHYLLPWRVVFICGNRKQVW